jgi:hypothetical protein
MPDIVNDDDLSALAAEYVLGTLDPNERTRASVLLDVDHQFLGMVRIWERRLGELHLMVEPVEPEPRIWQRIRGKLKDVAPIAATAATAAVPPPVTPKMPSGAPFPAPVDHKPTPPATATGHQLASLFHEVEKLTADPKLAEQKNAEVKPAEPAPLPLGALAPSPGPAPFPAPELKVSDATSASLGDADVVLPQLAPPAQSPPTSDDTKTSHVIAASHVAEPAEVQPIDVLTAVLEPGPTVAELAAKLAPEPVEPVPDEPRSVDRIRREPAGAAIAEPVRTKPKRPAIIPVARPANVGLWRGIAALMLLMTVALSGLIASWRYIPERLPAGLRPAAVLNLPDVTSSIPKKSVAIVVQFDE